MIKNVNINSFFKNILNYCKMSTQQSMMNLIKKNKNNFFYINNITVKKIVDAQNENKYNNDIIIPIYVVLSISSLLFYLNKNFKGI